MKIKTARNLGFSSLELIIYSAGMIVILSLIFYMISNIYGFYQKITLEPRIDRVGTIIMDRLIKDIRSGYSIDMSNSQFNTPTGSLVINTTLGRNNVTKNFDYQGGRITYNENSGEVNFISPEDLSVSKFFFQHFTSGISEAIKIDLGITYNLDKDPKTKNFTSFVILRRSYE